MAVKIINGAKVHRDFWEKFLPRELHNWWHLSHDNIVGLRARFKEASWTFMVAEYLDGGDLLDFVQKTNLTESLAHSYVKQIFEAVRYLHVDKNLAHRDLKLENILMSADRKTVKLADFGFSRRVSSSELVKTTCGSKAYMSPDILRGEPYDPKKADVWSLGVITFILVSGRMPFDESVGTLGLLRAQRDRTYRYPLDMPVSHDCRQFIHDLLTFEETNRPDVATASKFSWIVRNSIGLKTC